MLILYLAGKVDAHGRMEIRQVNSYQCFRPEFWKRTAKEHEEAGRLADAEMIAALGRREELKAAEAELSAEAEKVFTYVTSGVCYVELGEWDMMYLYPVSCGAELLPDMLGIWTQYEQPRLHGKQMMIQSFLFSDMAGRRIIGAMPDMENGQWFALLEGGTKLYFREDVPYSREILDSRDIGSFTIGQTDGIIDNPVYGYGTAYFPGELCSEWHKVFEFALAVSENTWEAESVQHVYERFLQFLEENVCVTMEAEPIIEKTQYLRALLITVENIRKYLQGQEEAVISKDLLLLMNSRYVYLPEIYQILYGESVRAANEVNEAEKAEKIFSAEVLGKYLDQAAQGTPFEKGLRFEEAAAYFMEAAGGLRIAGRRVKTEFQEIDLCLVNVSLDQELWDMGAFILVECKNWKKAAGVTVVRELGLTARMRGNKTTILISKNGWTRDAAEEAEGRLFREFTSSVSQRMRCEKCRMQKDVRI